MKQLFIFIFLLFISLTVSAQEKESLKNVDLNVYGIFRAHLATFGQEAEIQDASPRVGFMFDYHFGRNDRFKVFFGGEFAINLIDNTFNFQADPNTNDGGFTILEFRDKKSTFSTRLGFVGIDFAKYGIITMGKLNSVYKSVAGTPDIFNVLSGQASYVYSPTGADGGETGTGRADGAIIYRNSFWRFDYGLQTQMRANGGNHFFDNYGASVKFHLTDHLTIGTAYNKTFLDVKFKELEDLRGLEGDPEYYTVGITYTKGPLFISALYANQKNGDFINTIIRAADKPDPDKITVIYPGKGYEFVASYYILEHKLRLLGGFNYKQPNSDTKLLPQGFRKRFYLLGMQYQFLKFASVYTEYRFEDSIDGLGRKPPNVFLIGLRIDFDRTWSKHIEL